MINILERSREFSKVDTYLMTIAPSIKSMKDVPDDTSIPYAGHIIFEDVKDTGEISEILSIITPDREVYSMQSETFKRSLKDIIDVMGEGASFSIKKISGKSKGGRDYINCELDITSVNE